jgi:hypothetical protein
MPSDEIDDIREQRQASGKERPALRNVEQLEDDRRDRYCHDKSDVDFRSAP